MKLYFDVASHICDLHFIKEYVILQTCFYSAALSSVEIKN